MAGLRASSTSAAVGVSTLRRGHGTSAKEGVGWCLCLAGLLGWVLEKNQAAPSLGHPSIEPVGTRVPIEPVGTRVPIEPVGTRVPALSPPAGTPSAGCRRRG